MPAPDAHSFPAAQVLQLVTLLSRWDIASEVFLQGSGLDEADLSVPHARVSLETIIALTDRARQLSGEPGLGFYLGLQKRLNMYGYLGFATMSASTVREGLQLTSRYAPTVSTGLGVDLLEEGDNATLLFEERVDLGPVHDVAIFSLLVGISQLSKTMTGREAGAMVADIPIPEPDYFPRFAHLLPGARFDRDGLRVHFDRRALDLPLLTPDAAALALAREACERELSELGFAQQLPAQVRRLAIGDDALRGVEEVARALHMSGRTLKRRLAEQGHSFSELVEAGRRERAISLLRQPDLTVDQIAARLHYATAPGFSRAFRRWTGMSPVAYRRREP